MPIVLYDKESNRRLFEVSQAELDSMAAALVKESASDRDYYIDAAVCEFLDGKVDAGLVAKLRGALGLAAPPSPAEGEVAEAGVEEELPEADLGEGGIEIEWRKE